MSRDWTDGRAGHIGCLPLALLAAFVALPFAVYLTPAHWLRGEAAPDPPRYAWEWRVPPGDPKAPPTRGMTVNAAGRGTVLEAPAPRVVEEAEAGPIGFVPDALAMPDIARFLAALPRERLLNPRPDRVMTLDLEGPTIYRDRIVLVNGCLRLQREGEAPGAIVAVHTALGRDADGWLTLGPVGAPPQHALRVGEAGGVIEGAAARREPRPAPPEIARLCGADTIVTIARVGRVPVCSAASIERMRAERSAYEAALAQSRACAGKRPCPPPPPAPAPPWPTVPTCTMPPGS